MDQFDVNHEGFADHNSQMGRFVNQMGDIISGLNRTLAGIPDAYGGQAAPVWAENQHAWDTTYRNAETHLNTLKDNHVHVADIFTSGDSAGARIMS